MKYSPELLKAVDHCQHRSFITNRYTGEYGMLIFNRAMQDLMDKRGWLIANSNFSPIQKAGSSITSNGYAAGYQFVKYIAHNGIEVELVHMPLYDGRSLNRQIDPVTGFPVESMRFTFIDILS